LISKSGRGFAHQWLIMKVIFLDIDGVLNCSRTPNPRSFPYLIDPKLLTRLRRLLQRTRAKVVLTSTWRYDPIGRLAAKHFRIPLIDCTPDLPEQPRRDEILQWLSAHPNVSRYVVIDDDDDELDDLPLFQPSSATGLSPQIASGVANFLNGKRKKDMRRNVVVRLLQNARSALKMHEG
jgi:hypothetical protein